MDDSAYSEIRWSSTGADRAPAGLAHTLMTLLSDAERCLAADQMSAKWSIARARSLLEAEWPEWRDASSAAPPPAKGGLPPRTMRRLEAYIDENLGSRIKILDLTKVAGLSVRHFSRFRPKLRAVAPRLHCPSQDRAREADYAAHGRTSLRGRAGLWPCRSVASQQMVPSLAGGDAIGLAKSPVGLTPTWPLLRRRTEAAQARAAWRDRLRAARPGPGVPANWKWADDRGPRPPR